MRETECPLCKMKKDFLNIFLSEKFVVLQCLQYGRAPEHTEMEPGVSPLQLRKRTIKARRCLSAHPPCRQGPRDRWSRERKKKRSSAGPEHSDKGKDFSQRWEKTTETIDRETVNPGKVPCLMAHPVTPPVTSLENAQLLGPGFGWFSRIGSELLPRSTLFGREL